MKVLLLFWFGSLAAFAYSGTNSAIASGNIITNGETGCDYEYTRYKDWCYYSPQNETATYDKALKICRSEGGDLVSIHNDDENEFLKRNFSYSLTGLQYLENGSFVWSDGTPLNYRQLNDSIFKKFANYFGRCVRLSEDQWEHAECEADEWSYVCKKKPSLYTNKNCPDPKELHLDSGVISSPSYPLPYHGSGNECTYRLAATLGNLINITFSHLELKCRYGATNNKKNRDPYDYNNYYSDYGSAISDSDTIRVYEGFSKQPKYLLGTLNCTAPSDFTLYTRKLNRVLLTFHAAQNNTGKWKVEWGHFPKDGTDTLGREEKQSEDIDYMLPRKKAAASGSSTTYGPRYRRFDRMNDMSMDRRYRGIPS